MTTGVAAVLAGGLTAGWLLFYLAVVWATRPATVRAGVATPELGPEPPAVVNLLVNRWRLTGDAAEATLLDLAARRILELRQAGDDPVNTTVHIRDGQPAHLLPYEEHVLERVRRLAQRGVVPVTALAFRDRARARGWGVTLRRMVVADARRRGLSRRRIGQGLAVALVTAAGLPAFAAAAAGFMMGGHEPALSFGGIWWVGLVLLTVWSLGERDTPAGVAAAQRWLGVRAWLRGHEEFANLPPASVTVWDRYLAYGAALGVTRVTSAVLDLAMGDHRRVWSSYGGNWRRVRVRYPRLRPHLGTTNAWLAVLVGVALLVGLLFLCGALGVAEQDPRAALVPLGVGLAVTAYGTYALMRGWGESGRSRTVTGEVLWLRPWRRRWYERGHATPWLHYLAIDDGGGDETVAWGLPSDWAERVVEGDTVQVTVRPWRRRVTDLHLRAGGPRRADFAWQVVPPGGAFENPRTPEPGQPWVR